MHKNKMQWILIEYNKLYKASRVYNKSSKAKYFHDNSNRSKERKINN